MNREILNARLEIAIIELNLHLGADSIGDDLDGLGGVVTDDVHPKPTSASPRVHRFRSEQGSG
jgi:hypothetical protein